MRNERRRDVIFICKVIANKENSADFQRLSLLSKLSNLTVCTERSTLDKLDSSVSYSLMNVTGKLWVMRCAVRILKNYEPKGKKVYVYSSPGLYALLVSVIISRIRGWTLVVDFWDHPSLGFELAGPLIKRLKKILWFVIRLMISKDDNFILAMEPGISKHLPECVENVYSVERGVVIDSIEPVSSSYSDDLKLVSVGWLYRIRGTEFLVKCMQELENRGLSATLKSAGSSDNYSLSMVEKHNRKSNNKIEHLGFIDKEEISEIYKWSNYGFCILDQSILNYRYAYPIKVVEYMAAHVVCIATRTYGIETMLDSKTGLLVDSGDIGVKQVCDFVEVQSKKEWEDMALCAFDSVARYDIANLNKSLSVIYKEIGICD